MTMSILNIYTVTQNRKITVNKIQISYSIWRDLGSENR